MTSVGRVGLRAVLLAAIPFGCGEESRCEFVERAAGLDETIGGDGIGALRDELSGTYTGMLSWEIGVQQLNDTPPVGGTSFTMTLALGDAPTYQQGTRVGGDDNERLACPSEVHYDAVVELSTGDGVLDERWEGVAIAPDDAASRLIIELVDPPFSLPLTVPDDIADKVDETELIVGLFPLLAEEGPPAVGGSISWWARGVDDGARFGQRWSIARLSSL